MWQFLVFFSKRSPQAPAIWHLSHSPCLLRAIKQTLASWQDSFLVLQQCHYSVPINQGKFKTKGVPGKVRPPHFQLTPGAKHWIARVWQLEKGSHKEPKVFNPGFNSIPCSKSADLYLGSWTACGFLLCRWKSACFSTDMCLWPALKWSFTVKHVASCATGFTA